MKVLITGAAGQVGTELRLALTGTADVVACTRADMPLDDADAIRRVIRTVKPDVVLNPGAYTAVDQAEGDELEATSINADAVAIIAAEVAKLDALLIHYSTDYVFDGTMARSYVESDQVNPVNAYGRSKLLGELVLLDSDADWLCLRTSWVYGPHGKNFFLTMTRLMRERSELRIVDDQIGCPTSSAMIAEFTVHAMHMALNERASSKFTSEIMHMTASGEASWFGFANAIADRLRKIVPLKVDTIAPIPASAYPLPAKRPANSRLDCRHFETRFDCRLPGWSEGLDQCVARWSAGSSATLGP